jgi:hypothetical protein
VFEPTNLPGDGYAPGVTDVHVADFGTPEWHTIKVKWYEHLTSGYVKVYVDGVLDCTVTGRNTLAFGPLAFFIIGPDDTQGDDGTRYAPGPYWQCVDFEHRFNIDRIEIEIPDDDVEPSTLPLPLQLCPLPFTASGLLLPEPFEVISRLEAFGDIPPHGEACLFPFSDPGFIEGDGQPGPGSGGGGPGGGGGGVLHHFIVEMHGLIVTEDKPFPHYTQGTSLTLHQVTVTAKDSSNQTVTAFTGQCLLHLAIVPSTSISTASIEFVFSMSNVLIGAGDFAVTPHFVAGVVDFKVAFSLQSLNGGPAHLRLVVVDVDDPSRVGVSQEFWLYPHVGG